MRAWKQVVAFGMIAALLAPSDALAAPSRRTDWRRVHALAPGTRVLVRLAGKAEVRGRVAAVDAESLTIQAKEGVLRVARAEVREVRRAGRSGLRKVAGFLIGAVVGALGGTFLGAGISSCNACEDPGLVGAVYGFLIGAITGGIAGVAIAARGDGAVVYRSPGGPR